MLVSDGPNRDARRRNVTQALQVGASLQVVCIVLPILDLWLFGSVDRHVRAAYPDWSETAVAGDRTAIVVYLVLIGVVGLAGWLGALWAVRRTRHERRVVTTLFAIGMVLLVVNAGLGGDSYQPIVPLWLGLTLLFVPALPGLTALVAVWQRSDG